MHVGFVFGVSYNPHLLHNFAVMCVFLHTGLSALSLTSLQCDASFFLVKLVSVEPYKLEGSSPKRRLRLLVLERKI